MIDVPAQTLFALAEIETDALTVGVTVIVTLFLGALSLAGAVFMIEELNRPLEGLMKVSGAPIRYALAHLGQ